MSLPKLVRRLVAGTSRPFAMATPMAIVLAACGGGGGGGSEAPQAPSPAVASAAPTRISQGTLLQPTWSAYPRLVRLTHQADPSHNGRIVTSLTEFAAGQLQAGFHMSLDDGVTFTRLGTLRSAAFAGGLRCGTLFELPRAVGALPAGTLLYAASTGQDKAGDAMVLPIFRSDDGGLTFLPIADAACGRAAVGRRPGAEGTGVWEPEFLVAADGSLACIFSDETEPGYSQVLKITTTSDGLRWAEPRVVVGGLDAADRPGMAMVRRLPDGRYVMSFEHCHAHHLDCIAHLRFSADGLDWGAADAVDTQPRTAGGRLLRHAPTLAWVPSAAPATGALVLIGQLVALGSGAVDTLASGQSVFVNDRGDGSGEWRLAAVPIGLAAALTTANWCQNYSTAMLPSLDGARLIFLQTDLTADGDCVARFGSGVVPRQTSGQPASARAQSSEHVHDS